MKIILSKFIALGLLLSIGIGVKAQRNPFQSIYFQNPYLYNPALAGINPGLVINTAYRQQSSNFPGTPKTGTLTADLSAGKVGLGITINDEQMGLIRQTRVMGSYAYHLQLSDYNQRLSFGLSLGLDDSRVSNSSVNGDLTDEEIAIYNQLKPYVDGDFGAAYTSNDFNAAVAIPNLKSSFFKTSDYRYDSGRLLFAAMASYKVQLQNEDASFVLEPLAGFRVVKGFNDIVDVGFNFTLNNYGLYFQSIYHTSQSLGLGFGLDQHTYAFNFAYNLETGLLNNYTQGAFELGIKLRLFQKSKSKTILLPR